MNLTTRSLGRLLDFVKGCATIVPLAELHRHWTNGRSTRGMLAVTFDDAYVSLLETADEWYTPDPFPVTIFVVSGATHEGSAFWWDRIEALAKVLRTEDWVSLAEACELPVNQSAQLNTWRDAFFALRQHLLLRHAGRAPGSFLARLSGLEALHGAATTQRAMRVDELKRMQVLGPVAFGVHTANHSALSLLSPKAASLEIKSCWEALQSWDLNEVLPILAAPFGIVGGEVPDLSAKAGMEACLSLDDRTLSHGPQGDGTTVMSRLSMVERTTVGRLAYRMSGLRDVVGDVLLPTEGPFAGGVHEG